MVIFLVAEMDLGTWTLIGEIIHKWVEMSREVILLLILAQCLGATLHLQRPLCQGAFHLWIMSQNQVVWVSEVTNILRTYPHRGGIHIGILLNYKDNILGMVKSKETINLVCSHIHKEVIHLPMLYRNGMGKLLGITNLFGVLLFKDTIHHGT